MAFAASGLVLLAHGNDQKLFAYVTTADSAATVRAVGYFNNTDDDIRMTANDTIIAVCSDNTVKLKVSSVSSGAVTTVADTGVALFAHDVTTSLSVPGQGIVTFTPTSDAMGTFQIGAAPVPGDLLELINIASNSSATALIEGNTTSTDEFGVTGNNTLELFFGGSVQLRAVSTTQYAIVGGSELPVSTSVTGRVKAFELSN